MDLAYGLERLIDFIGSTAPGYWIAAFPELPGDSARLENASAITVTRVGEGAAGSAGPMRANAGHRRRMACIMPLLSIDTRFLLDLCEPDGCFATQPWKKRANERWAVEPVVTKRSDMPAQVRAELRSGNWAEMAQGD